MPSPAKHSFFSAVARAVLATAVAGSAGFVGVAKAQDADRAVENDIENIRRNVQLVDDDLKRSRDRERKYPLDRRFVEATLAYDRGNLSTAAVMLVDLVQNPEFQARSDYGDALFMLGDSLYRQRNYAGAKRYLDRIVQVPGSKYFQQALAELVDIAVRMRRMEEVQVLAKKLDIIPSDSRKS